MNDKKYEKIKEENSFNTKNDKKSNINNIDDNNNNSDKELKHFNFFSIRNINDNKMSKLNNLINSPINDNSSNVLLDNLHNFYDDPRNINNKNTTDKINENNKEIINNDHLNKEVKLSDRNKNAKEQKLNSSEKFKDYFYKRNDDKDKDKIDDNYIDEDNKIDDNIKHDINLNHYIGLDIKKKTCLNENNSILLCINSNEKKIVIRKHTKIYDSFSESESKSKKKQNKFKKKIILILSPNSCIKTLIDLEVLIIFLYISIVMPFKITTFSPFIIYYTLEFFVDIVFIIDFLLSFFIGFYDLEKNYVNDISEIFYEYLSSFLFLDLICAIPFNSIFNIYNYNNFYKAVSTLIFTKLNIENSKSNFYSFFLFDKKILLILGLLKILKIIKIIKKNQFITFLFRYLKIENFRNNKIYRVFLYLIIFILISHILSCIFIFVATISEENWIIYHKLKDSDFIDVYISALYFVNNTIFTIGYGDIITINIYERIFNIILMIIGVILYSFILAKLSEQLKTKDLKEKKYEENKEIYNQIFKKCLINKNLDKKILEHLLFEKKSKCKDKKNNLLNVLPINLRYNIVFKINKEIIESINIFKNCKDKDFIISTISILKSINVKKGEILIKKNDYIQEIFIVKKGYLNLEVNIRNNAKDNKKRKLNELKENEIEKEKNLKILSIRKNEDFGCSLMLDNKKSPCSVKAKCKNMEVFSIKKIDLIKLEEKFNEIIKKNYKSSKKLINYINNKIKTYKRNSLKGNKNAYINYNYFDKSSNLYNFNEFYNYFEENEPNNDSRNKINKKTIKDIKDTKDIEEPFIEEEKKETFKEINRIPSFSVKSQKDKKNPLHLIKEEIEESNHSIVTINYADDNKIEIWKNSTDCNNNNINKNINLNENQKLNENINKEKDKDKEIDKDKDKNQNFNLNENKAKEIIDIPYKLSFEIYHDIINKASNDLKDFPENQNINQCKSFIYFFDDKESDNDLSIGINNFNSKNVNTNKNNNNSLDIKIPSEFQDNEVIENVHYNRKFPGVIKTTKPNLNESGSLYSQSYSNLIKSQKSLIRYLGNKLIFIKEKNLIKFNDEEFIVENITSFSYIYKKEHKSIEFLESLFSSMSEASKHKLKSFFENNSNSLSNIIMNNQLSDLSGNNDYKGSYSNSKNFFGKSDSNLINKFLDRLNFDQTHWNINKRNTLKDYTLSFSNSEIEMSDNNYNNNIYISNHKKDTELKRVSKKHCLSLSEDLYLNSKREYIDRGISRRINERKKSEIEKQKNIIYEGYILISKLDYLLKKLKNKKAIRKDKKIE